MLPIPITTWGRKGERGSLLAGREVRKTSEGRTLELNLEKQEKEVNHRWHEHELIAVYKHTVSHVFSIAPTAKTISFL